tara:strand:- start:25 stop:756 length:732 start_codon:yes stop_codon:yes gene_type:complete
MTKFLKTNYNQTIAYNKIKGDKLGIVFLSGLKSDMTGQKAIALEEWAIENNHSFLRFDYSGHGISSGNFEDFVISDWILDARTVINNLTKGPQILVGSSMGGWIMLALAKRKLANIHSLIGLAAAPDFTKTLIWDSLSLQKKQEVINNNKFSLNEDLKISYDFIQDGENNLVLNSPIEFKGSVYLYHGMMDNEVPFELSERVLNTITISNDVKLIIEKHGEHRLSKDEEIKTIKAILNKISNN